VTLRDSCEVRTGNISQRKETNPYLVRIMKDGLSTLRKKLFVMFRKFHNKCINVKTSSYVLILKISKQRYLRRYILRAIRLGSDTGRLGYNFRALVSHSSLCIWHGSDPQFENSFP
jgi:hypothetical protein